MKLFVKVLHGYDKEYSYDACDLITNLKLA